MLLRSVGCICYLLLTGRRYVRREASDELPSTHEAEHMSPEVIALMMITMTMTITITITMLMLIMMVVTTTTAMPTTMPTTITPPAGARLSAAVALP